MASFQLIKSETVYRGRAFNIRRDEVRLPDGKVKALDVVDHTGAVTILPVDAEKNIYFVRQYRHPAQGELLELPAGTIEKGELPLNCAAREIREETGFSAKKMEKLGDFYMVPGYSTEHMYVFLATGLEHDPLKADDDEFLSLVVIPAKQAYEMLEKGEFHDAKTIVGLFLARPYL
jgi:ADP-ribose pyrophosphatase